jgi:AcrR family transcriptional regulator
MPKRPARGRPRSPVLGDQKILLCALRLADERGIDALSMRTIAGKLGVEAMSLYNHVSGKDHILDGIVDLVIAEIRAPAVGGDWKMSMRQWALSSHEVLLRHPWAAVLIESRPNLSPVRLKYGDSVLGALRGAGFNVDTAYQAFLTIDSYIYGFTLQEVSWPYPANEVPARIEDVRGQIPAGEFPHITEVMEAVLRRRALSPAAAYESEFVFGLDLILTGLDRILTESRKTV